MNKTKAQRRMALAAVLTVGFLLASAGLALAHDMFAKPATFFARENSDVMVRVLNGTFTGSLNSIARVRLRDVSVLSPSGRATVDTSAWNASGDTSTFVVHTGAAGTYVVGAATRPNVLAMTADTFNMYLGEEGIPDVLAARRRAGELKLPAKERYSKHVKSLIQVGSKRTEDYATPLGYAAEIVPLTNPYSLRAGAVLRVKTLVDGNPVARQLVLFGGRTANGARIAERSTRSNANGVAAVPLRARGMWYVKFINMQKAQGDTVDYESKWATLTFEIR